MSKPITTGQDSFLDIVANLVGILIILVVAVSAQATASLSRPEPDTSLVETIEAMTADLSQTNYLMTKLEIDNEQLEKRLIEENLLAGDLTDQRHAMLVQLEIIKQEMENFRKQRLDENASLDARQKEIAEKMATFEAEKRRLENELRELSNEIEAVAAHASPPSEVIEHRPNPIAKTVFSEEIHFRLSDGVISHVPLDELIVRMKAEWKVKAEKLKQASRTIETIGPIGNYRMQYELTAGKQIQDTPNGPMEARTVQFQRFRIFPKPGRFGEPVERALENGSEFRDILKRHEPGSTTVSIWVYPDSYAGHNEIKTWLHKNGFQMASWPLDFGKSISGGPNGFRSSAQ